MRDKLGFSVVDLVQCWRCDLTAIGYILRPTDFGASWTVSIDLPVKAGEEVTLQSVACAE